MSLLRQFTNFYFQKVAENESFRKWPSFVLYKREF